MRILIISKDGDGLGIAHRMEMEGHSVSMYIQDPRFKLAGRGLIRRVQSWRPELASADLVLCDMVGFGRHERLLRRFGVPTLGCSAVADLLELDRGKSMELFQRVGMTLPETLTCNSPSEARLLLRDWEPPGYVLKPFNNQSTAKTLVVRDPDIMEWALSQYGPGDKLLVQRIVDGVEVSTEGWFNGRAWVKPFNHTFEEKRFLPGGLGPNTGCMGNVVVPAGMNRLVEETVLRLGPFLKKIGYRGPVDVNSIVNEMGAHVLEITPRFGYDAIEALAEGLREPLADFLFDMATGIKTYMDLPMTDKMIAVRLSLPPWPGGQPQAAQAGMPIKGLNAQNLKHIYLTDVMREGDEYKWAAGDGVLMKVTARGRTVDEARRRAYRTIGNLTIQDVQYRKDIGAHVDGDVERLKAWGYM